MIRAALAIVAFMLPIAAAADALDDCRSGRCEGLVGQRVYLNISSARPGKIPICKRPGEFTACTEVREGSWIVRNIVGYDQFRKAMQVTLRNGEIGYIDTANLHVFSLTDPAPARKKEADRERLKAEAFKFYFECVKAKALEFSKSTEPANVVARAALAACPGEQSRLSAATGLAGPDLHKVITRTIEDEVSAFVIKERLSPKKSE
jgi:hypothetical protein